MNVVTGGYMPEYGQTIGGAVSAITKSGGNEFHGSVFGTWTPGGRLHPTIPCRRRHLRAVERASVDNRSATSGRPWAATSSRTSSGSSPASSSRRTRYSYTRTYQNPGRRARELVNAPVRQRRRQRPRSGRRRQSNFIGKLTYLITRTTG